METRKLYYEDPHLRSFTATVTACGPEGALWAVELDATAFYPEGGGQACDLGVLGDTRVTAVREDGHRVIHLCEGPLQVGQTVTGAIDWARRFDLMQQHTGEHMVSGVIHRRYGWHNVGFHMGAELVTIDFDGPIPQEDLASIEQEVNAMIWQDLPVACGWPAEAELPGIPYRSKRALPWPVRIVQIPGADICACCGTHVKTTGELGLVKLFSCVKFHQGVRLEMACGGRAVALLSRVWEQNRQVSQAFSAKVLETGEAARKMNEALAAEKFRSAGLQKQLFEHVAARYAGSGNTLHITKDLTGAGLRELAERIAAVCGGIAAVFSGEGESYSVCLACPGGDVKALGAAMAAALQGRGGGKPGFYQGSVQCAEENIRDFFAASWEK